MVTHKVVFDAAHLTDAVTKAAKIAPVKGNAFDKAAGLLFTIDGDHAVVKATNLDITYMQRIPVLDAPAEELTWRIPSGLISSVAASLDMEEGQQVSFFDKGDSQLRLKQGTFIAAFPMFDSAAFPRIEPFDASGLSEATEFGDKVANVSWVCKNAPGDVLSGVHIDGEYLYATDGYALAAVPCAAPVTRPVTAPARDIAVMLRAGTDVRLAATERFLQIQLDKETQITSTLFAQDYPKVRQIMRDTTTDVVRFRKDQWTDTVNRMLLVVSRDNTQPLDITIDPDEHKMVLNISTDTGRVMDEIAIDTDSTRRAELCVTPAVINGAISNARGGSIEVHHGHVDLNRDPALCTLVIQDGTGYEAHVMPRKK